MLTDNKKYGLSVNLMATRVMPSLLPLTMNAALHLDQFTSLVEVLQEMLDTIDKWVTFNGLPSLDLHRGRVALFLHRHPLIWMTKNCT